MERILLSRQPVFDAKMRELGYELLYRNNDEDHAAFSDGDQATAEVILNTFDIGLEELVGKHLAFINFDRKLIISDHCEALPKDRVVLEIVKDIEPDEALLRRLAELRATGYRTSVAGIVGSGEHNPMMETAHFVRFDITGDAWMAIEQSMALARNFPVQLIAEHIETREQFERCRNLGFDYFQGYFLGKPQPIEARRTSVNRLSTLRMIATLNDPQIKVNDVEKAISQDARLTYKLLRYANSAMCGLNRPVESVQHAVVLIGLEKMRIWASLLLLYGMDDKTPDMIITGPVRARMCEQLAKAQGAQNPDKLFMVGLFSILDAIVDQPRAGALSTLPLSPAVADAILHQRSELGAVLKGVLAYDRQDWVQARSGVKLPPETVRQAFVDAVGWSLRTLHDVSETSEKKTQKSNKDVDGPDNEMSSLQ